MEIYRIRLNFRSRSKFKLTLRYHTGKVTLQDNSIPTDFNVNLNCNRMTGKVRFRFQHSLGVNEPFHTSPDSSSWNRLLIRCEQNNTRENQWCPR